MHADRWLLWAILVLITTEIVHLFTLLAVWTFSSMNCLIIASFSYGFVGALMSWIQILCPRCRRCVPPACFFFLLTVSVAAPKFSIFEGIKFINLFFLCFCIFFCVGGCVFAFEGCFHSKYIHKLFNNFSQYFYIFFSSLIWNLFLHGYLQLSIIF